MFDINSSSKLERELATFSPTQLELIMSNLIGMQLTQGCSVCCVPGCGLGAQRGIREHIPFDLIQRIYTAFPEEIRKTRAIHYFASEPFDYSWEDKTYLDVFNLANQNGYNPYVSTAIPKGKEKEILQLILDSGEVDEFALNEINFKIERLRYFLKRDKPSQKKELKKLMDKIGVDLQPNEFYSHDIMKDFSDPQNTLRHLRNIRRRIITWPKSNIIDRVSFGAANEKRIGLAMRELTSDWTRLLGHPYFFEPSFDDRYYQITNLAEAFEEQGIDFKKNLHKFYFPQKRIVYLENENVFLAKNNNMDETIYCQKVGDSDRQIISFLDWPHISDYLQAFVRRTNLLNFRTAQGEIINVNYDNLGPKHRNNLAKEGITCVEGTLLTPKGVFNIERVVPTIENPYDFKKTPVRANNFQIKEYERDFERTPFVDV